MSPSGPVYQPEVVLHRWLRRPVAPHTDLPHPHGTWGRWNCTQSLVLRKKHTLSKHHICHQHLSPSPRLVQSEAPPNFGDELDVPWVPCPATGASRGLGNDVKEEGEEKGERKKVLTIFLSSKARSRTRPRAASSGGRSRGTPSELGPAPGIT